MTLLKDLQVEYESKYNDTMGYVKEQKTIRNKLFIKSLLLSLLLISIVSVIIALIFKNFEAGDVLQLIASVVLLSAIFNAIVYELLNTRFHNRVVKRKNEQLNPLRHEIIHKYIDGIVLSTTPLIEENHYRVFYINNDEKINRELYFNKRNGEINFVN